MALENNSMTEIKTEINPKCAALGLFLISRIPGRVNLGDGTDATIGEVLAHSIVAGAKKAGGESVLMMDATIALMEGFTTDDPSLTSRVQEMNFLGGELRETLGYAVLAPAPGMSRRILI